MTDPKNEPIVADEVEALRVARDYVVDALNERQEELNRVGAYPKLAKREEARLEAIKEDIRLIDAALTAKLSETEENAKLRARVEELEGLIGRIEPHVDAIVCYASTMGEHEPNRIAHEVRAIAGRFQNELAGEATAHPARQEETGWLVELKGQTPSWSTLFAGDYDDHWTEENTKAIRFARKVDAEAWIAWHGWTEAFASEHIWSDGRARSNLGGTGA